MRLLIAVVLMLVAPPAWAQPLPLPQAMRERVLLVWGGGRTPAEAEAFMASYQARAEDWSRVLEPGPGYPRVIDGAELPGLRPGYSFVALGVCEAREGRAMEKVFKALEPLSYARRVLWDEREPVACPSLLPGWTFGRSTQTRLAGGTLSAVTFEHEEEGSHRSWLLILAVLRKNGDVASKVLEPEEEDGASEVKKLRAGGGQVVLEEWLTMPTCDTGPVEEVHARTWNFSVKQGGFVTKQRKKLLRRKPCAPRAGEVEDD